MVTVFVPVAPPPLLADFGELTQKLKSQECVEVESVKLCQSNLVKILLMLSIAINTSNALFCGNLRIPLQSCPNQYGITNHYTSAGHPRIQKARGALDSNLCVIPLRPS